MATQLLGRAHLDDARTFASYVNTWNLSTSPTTITVPAGYDYVRVNCDGNIGIRINGTAATGGAGNVTDGTGTEIYPPGTYYFILSSDVSSISALAETGTVDTSWAFFKGQI